MGEPLRYVEEMYRRYTGRVPVAVGVSTASGSFDNVYPFVFELGDRGPVALVACQPERGGSLPPGTSSASVAVTHLSALGAEIDLTEVRSWLESDASRVGVRLTFSGAHRIKEPHLWPGDTRPGPRFVNEMHRRFAWRVPLSVGLTIPGGHLAPSVVVSDTGQPVGLAGCAWNEGADQDLVQVYHVSAFRHQTGHGSFVLAQLCAIADSVGARLYVQAQPLFDDRGDEISQEALLLWYRRFGFAGIGPGLTRAARQ